MLRNKITGEKIEVKQVLFANGTIQIETSENKYVSGSLSEISLNLTPYYETVKNVLKTIGESALIANDSNLINDSEYNDWIKDPENLIVGRVFISEKNLTWIAINAPAYIDSIHSGRRNTIIDMTGGSLIYLFTIPKPYSPEESLMIILNELSETPVIIELKPV